MVTCLKPQASTHTSLTNTRHVHARIASSSFGSVLALTSRSGEGPRLHTTNVWDGQHIPVAKHCPMPTKQAHIETLTNMFFLPTLSFPCSWTHTNSQVSPDEPLYLEEFACRTVSVSFVVVNRFGVSQESPPLTLNVPGGIYIQ